MCMHAVVNGNPPAPARPACILTFRVSRGCIDVCEAARATAPASTSWSGLSAGGGPDVLLPDFGRVAVTVPLAGGIL